MPSIMKREINMTLKNFDEFKKSLTQEDIDYINGVNDEDSPKLETILENPNAFTEIAGFIAALSFKMNVRLLELYHEWISEQLEK